MTTLLVASGGGHLTQLRLLLTRICPAVQNGVWVTYDTPQAREMLQGEEVVFGYPSTRNLPNAVRNFQLAGRVLRDRDVTRVISTGAGISVPFMVRARRRGIPCHYIESATRVQSPSLSGRMLERVPGVVLYTQYPHWIRPGWFFTGSVYDGFRPQGAGDRAPRKVVVSLGTHGYRFDRLVRSLRSVLPREAEVVWQLGASVDLQPAGDVRERVDLSEFHDLIVDADLVAGHAGVGLSLTVLRAGKTPLLSPRRARHGEHVDDHQAVVARELESRGLAIVRDAEAITREDLGVAAGGRVERDDAAPFHLVSTETEDEPADTGPVRPLRTPSTWRRRLGSRLALTDALIIALSSSGAYLIRQLLGEAGVLEGFASEVPAALSVLPLWLAIIHAVGGYRPQYLNSAGDAFRRFSAGVTGGVLALGFASFMFNWQLSRVYVVLLALMVFLLGGLARLDLRRRLVNRHRAGDGRQNVLVVGTDDEALEVVAAIERSELAGYRVVGFLDDDLPVGSSVDRLGVLGRPEDVLGAAYEHRAGLVIVSPTGVRPGTLRELTVTLEGSPIDLAVAPSLFQVVTRRVTVESVANVPILHVDQIRLERGKAALKRMLDLMVALGLGLVTIPVMFGAAIAIRARSPGPVFFRQRRIGRDGDPFTMVKFRTMVPDAEEQLVEVEHLNEAGHAFFKVREDPRVTPVGRFLRKWSIDELPQLWNVLRGDMSMVGPRPPLPEEVEKYEPWQLRRLRVRPGITGVWQVSGRSNVPFDEAVRMDLFYIENWSLGYDLFLLGKTVLAVLGRVGAY